MENNLIVVKQLPIIEDQLRQVKASVDERVAQVLALFKSLSYDITPDNPCPSGEVNRVVQGVTIYPYTK